MQNHSGRYDRVSKGKDDEHIKEIHHSDPICFHSLDKTKHKTFNKDGCKAKNTKKYNKKGKRRSNVVKQLNDGPSGSTP